MLKSWMSNALPALLIGVIFSLGATWKIEKALEQQFANATLNSAASRQKLINDISTASAARLEETLKELHASEIHTEKHFTLETVKPVFLNVCASDEYVRLFNETSEAAGRTLSGQRHPGVPDRPPDAGRPDGK